MCLFVVSVKMLEFFFDFCFFCLLRFFFQHFGVSRGKVLGFDIFRRCLMIILKTFLSMRETKFK